MEDIKAFVKSRTLMNTIIVIANIIVFLVLDLRGGTMNVEYMVEHGASYAPYIHEQGEYYRLITCMFLHFGVEHLFNNMLALVFLGNILEDIVGKVRYLLIYLLGGLAGNLLSYGINFKTASYAVSAGASGAVFAVVGALLYIVLANHGRKDTMTGKRLVLIAGLTIFEGFTSTGIDNAAHIGGLIGGFIIALIVYRRKERI